MSLRTLTNSNFSLFAEAIAHPSKPDEYCEASVERLMEYLNPYVEHVKNVKFKFHARNKIELIHFTTRAEQEAYENAWEDYLKSIAELEESGASESKFMILVQFLKFRQAAELIRAPYLARRLYEIVEHKNKAAIGAVNFKETISKIVSILVDDYNVSRNEISLIWGGMIEKKKKRKLKDVELTKLKEMFGDVLDENNSLFTELGIDVNDSTTNVSSISNEERERRVRLGLGSQNSSKRQEEIDKFQTDRSKYCIFTFKSGGVGLSLHQETPTNRQRETLLAPTYSAIELVQGLGRAPRLTSCSDTEQTVIFYANTIEVKVAQRASQKLKCLSKAVQKKETWEDVLYGVSKIEHNESELIEEELNLTSDIANDDSLDAVLAGDVEEDDSESTTEE